MSPGSKPSESLVVKREAAGLPLLESSSPDIDPTSSSVLSHPASCSVVPSSMREPEFHSPTSTTTQIHQVISGKDSLSETSSRPNIPSPSLKAVNGHADFPLSYEEPEVQEGLQTHLPCEVQTSTSGTSSAEESHRDVPVALEELQAEHLTLLAPPVPLVPTVQASSSTSVLAPPPGLTRLVQPAATEAPEPNKTSDDVQLKAQDTLESQNNSKFTATGMFC